MMYSTAALTSASDAAPPLGGIIPLPFITDAVRSAAPLLMSGAHAALPPAFGAITEWQPAQDLSHTALPSVAAAGPAARDAITTPRTATIARVISTSFSQVICSWGEQKQCYVCKLHVWLCATLSSCKVPS